MAARATPADLADDVLAQAEAAGTRYIDLQFTDVMGAVKTVTIPADQLPDTIEHGTWFDGSSVESFARTAESDMYLVPDLETFRVEGFRFSRPVRSAIPIFLAGLRPRALHLAGELGDGVLLNWLSPDDVPTVRAEVEKGVAASGQQKHIEVACRVFVCVGGDREMAEQAARRYLAAYVTVPVYEQFHRWLGRGDLLAPMLAAWREGRRREAVQLVPEEVVRDLVLYGDVEDCRTRLERYHAAGVDTIIHSRVMDQHVRFDLRDICSWRLGAVERNSRS